MWLTSTENEMVMLFYKLQRKSLIPDMNPSLLDELCRRTVDIRNKSQFTALRASLRRMLYREAVHLRR